MSFDGDGKQWKCVKGGSVNFQRVSSIVRDIGEPCLHQSTIKVVSAIGKMLKPDKWQSTFDNDGKIFGFRKVLKLIILGRNYSSELLETLSTLKAELLCAVLVTNGLGKSPGIDPSIRAEVWEFLLGCYSLSSTAEYRRQLRTARRERYRDLVKECQMMHSSIGTGSLAYVVGSKVLDMRKSSKEDRTSNAEVKSTRVSEASTKKKHDKCVYDNNCTDKSYTCRKESSSDNGDLVYVRGSTVGGAYDSSDPLPSPEPCDCSSPTSESYLDFPALPVTDLFEEDNEDKEVLRLRKEKYSTRRKLRYEDGRMHSFEITNNADLVVESNSFSSIDVSLYANSKSEPIPPDISESPWSVNLEYKSEMHEITVPDAPEVPSNSATTAPGSSSKDRVSEWLWTLHRIVVDVVRTDSHLEFYEDTKNLARMSDILSVYAWVDPSTGYCQGMSDLLSPFVVLFEDNADAFWCFEMLLRRVRENFKLEGPTGVMKQLQALWHILELTDKEMFTHLSHIGAESLHFAFRMLLVLFRRELSFNEALCMWEMIWAADFDLSLTCLLDENCPEVLTIQLPKETETESGEDSMDSNNASPKAGVPAKPGTLERSNSDNTGMKTGLTTPFCGLTRTFWSRNDHFHSPTLISSTKNGDDELPVFCVAAILITNRQKIIRETRSIDDLIKICNDNLLKIRIKRCVRTAIKLRKKYFYKLIKNRSPVVQNGS